MSAIRASLTPGLRPEDAGRVVDELRRRSQAGARRGAERAAARMQQTARATSAYRGQSGATRAGTVAYVADATDAGAAAFGAAYQEVVRHLAGFTGHDGRPARVSIPGPPPGGLSIVLTVPTDYVDKLEFEAAGARAFLGPTLAQEALGATALIAAAIREELG